MFFLKKIKREDFFFQKKKKRLEDSLEREGDTINKPAKLETLSSKRWRLIDREGNQMINLFLFFCFFICSQEKET